MPASWPECPVGGPSCGTYMNRIEITYFPPSLYFPFFYELFTDLVGNKQTLNMIPHPVHAMVMNRNGMSHSELLMSRYRGDARSSGWPISLGQVLADERLKR